MKDEIKTGLIERAKYHEKNYNKARPDNNISLTDIKPISETSAVGLYYSEPNGKMQLVFFYYERHVNGWFHFVPCSDHILGLMNLRDCYLEIEKYNFKRGGWQK